MVINIPNSAIITGSGAAALITACARKHRAGEKVFVDYTDGLAFVDIRSGEIIPTQFVVAVWGASNFTYAEATLHRSCRMDPFACPRF